VVISVENSSVVRNTAATFAGGIHVETDSTLHVTSSTVENNTAGDVGGESATFCALLTITYLFGTPHAEQVLGS
jgi:hypothetical protein